MKPITVHCALCLRPQRDQFRRVKERTVTCRRSMVWTYKRSAAPDDFVYYENNGEMTCSVEVLFP